MKAPLFIITTIMFCSCSIMAKAQLSLVGRADQQFEWFNYVKAIDLYEQAWKRKKTLHTAERLAIAYQQIRNYKGAESWSAIAANLAGSSADNKLRYARSLHNNGKYPEAKQQYQEYARLAGTAAYTNKLKTWLVSCDSATRWVLNPKPVILENVRTLNSAQSDFGVINYTDGIVFCSDRINQQTQTIEKKPFLKFDGDNFPNRKVSGWTGNNYFNLYLKGKGKDSIQLFPLRLLANTFYHIGTASFNADGKQIYFTITRIPAKSNQNKHRPSTINLEIYSSYKDTKGLWSVPVPYVHNNVEEYSIGDPFLTSNGNTLYFSSNMPGGLGGTDLYVCFRMKDGTWGKPVNLKKINTNGNERTPALDKDNNIYFSSDGRIGLGGLDIYKAHVNTKNAEIDTIENMGYPINSAQDDFAFNPTRKDGKFYFSSNRIGGLGSDDIYGYSEKLPPPTFKLKGIVYNKQTHTPLANAMVHLGKASGIRIYKRTDSLGRFNFDLQKNSAYKLTADMQGFNNDELQVSTVGNKKSSVLEKELYLEPLIAKKVIIHYDFNKSNIRSGAFLKLDSLVTIMKESPAIKIDLRAYTDSRGKDSYNLILSQKRVEKVIQYLVSKGINRLRISAKGHGETNLLNKCGEGILCSEAEHQLNRRTELELLNKDLPHRF